jgi:hypothetical protein
VNLLGDGVAGNDPDVASLHAQLSADRSCAGATCPGVVITDPDTVPPTPPGTPIGTSTAPGQIDLTWAASSDDRATTLTYRVYRDQETTPFTTVASASTTTVGTSDMGLLGGSSHTYRVTVSDGVHTVSSLTSALIAVPGSPTILTDSFAGGLAAWGPVRVTLDTQLGMAAPPSARVQVSNRGAYVRRSLGAMYPRVCVSANVQLTTVGGSANAALFKVRAGTTSIARLAITPARLLRVRNERTGAFANPGTLLPTGWHALEFCVTTGTAGSLSARLDGVTFASVSNQNLGTASIGSLQLFDDAARTITANIDDVVVR